MSRPSRSDGRSSFDIAAELVGLSPRDFAKARKVSLRSAAYAIAIARVAEAERLRGT
jgi:hypothetical protein